MFSVRYLISNSNGSDEFITVLSYWTVFHTYYSKIWTTDYANHTNRTG